MEAHTEALAPTLIHVHDQLNLTSQIAFKAGVRVNLVRSSFNRLRMRSGSTMWFGEYKTDATGNCETLVATGPANDEPTVSRRRPSTSDTVISGLP